jgi:hypothetical protein
MNFPLYRVKIAPSDWYYTGKFTVTLLPKVPQFVIASIEAANDPNLVIDGTTILFINKTVKGNGTNPEKTGLEIEDTDHPSFFIDYRYVEQVVTENNQILWKR